MAVQNQKIRIRLKAFDYRLIDQSALEIVETGEANRCRGQGACALCRRASSASMCCAHRT